MMKSKNINAICFHASFWPALIITIFSIPLCLMLFTLHTNDIVEKEYNRHELISELMTKAIISNVIIGNDDALFLTLEDFKKRYQLNGLKLTDQGSAKKLSLPDFIWSQSVCSLWKIPGLFPEKFIAIDSTIEKQLIITPLLATFCILQLFIMASMLMYQRIKRELHSKIVAPLKYTLNFDGQEINWLSKNAAASEIVDLYEKTKAFILTLHQQRDLLEKHKIEQAKYDIALQVAHDIRSPILALETIITLSTELKKENTAMIKNVTKRISQIAEDILKEYNPNIAEIKQDKIFDAPLPIVQVVKNLIKEKEIAYPNSKILFNLTIEDPAYLTLVQMSEEQITRILSNLINNSIESIDGTGMIQVSIHSDKENAYLHIKDTGCGISPQHLENLFKRGFSSNKTGGKGLGLSYAKEIIEKHNGKIVVESSLKNGTSVNITLPVTQVTASPLLLK